MIAGRFEGDTGLIVRVEENFVILFSDLTMHELKVLPRDLQLCSETASGVDVGGQHEWGELVQLDPRTVGVIVRLERETFQVLNMYGKVVTVRHQAVTQKKDNRFAVALDSEQNNIHVKDIVKVIDGPTRTGRVRSAISTETSPSCTARSWWRMEACLSARPATWCWPGA